MKVSVSILDKYDDLKKAINLVNLSNADFLHIDVMDGKFVNNKKFLYKDYKKAMKLTQKKTDVHMMTKSIYLIKKYAKLKPDILTVHVEVIKNNKIINYIKSKGIKFGLAINLETKVDDIIKYLNQVDLLLFMSVKPGLGGQEFKSNVFNKIKQLNNYDLSNKIISIDGGVNNLNINKIKEYNFNMVVSGSYVAKEDKIDEMNKCINNLK